MVDSVVEQMIGGVGSLANAASVIPESIVPILKTRLTSNKKASYMRAAYCCSETDGKLNSRMHLLLKNMM